MRIDQHQATQLTNHLAVNTKDQTKLLEQLATGKSINRASDDAAGLALANEFEQQVRTYRNASDNISAGMSALSIADGGASTISDMLQRQQELAVQSANGAYNQDQRDALDKEFQSLSQEIDRISKSTEYDGQKLLDGSGNLANGTGNVQAGSGSSDKITLPSSDLTLANLNIGGEKLDSPEAALKAMNAIDSAMRKVNDQRADQGSVQNRLESAMSNVQSQLVNTTQGLSNVEDLDFAKALSDKVRTDIVQESNTAALSQFNQLSRTHLLALLQ